MSFVHKMGSFLCFSGGNIYLDLMKRDEIFSIGHFNAAELVLGLSEAASCDLPMGKIPTQDAPSKGEGMCFLREQKDVSDTFQCGLNPEMGWEQTMNF